jgi:hypothetical protein
MWGTFCYNLTYERGQNLGPIGRSVAEYRTKIPECYLLMLEQRNVLTFLRLYKDIRRYSYVCNLIQKETPPPKKFPSFFCFCPIVTFMPFVPQYQSITLFAWTIQKLALTNLWTANLEYVRVITYWAKAVFESELSILCAFCSCRNVTYV